MLITRKPKIYFAGKIGKGDWRTSIAGTRGIQKIGEQIECENFIYNGPWFASCDHGCFHGKDSHGLGASGISLECIPEERDALGAVNIKNGTNTSSLACGETTNPYDVFRICTNAVLSSDIIFAWIDAPDCFGTLYELGIARAAHVPIVAVFSTLKLKKEMWLMALGCCATDFSKHPGKAFRKHLKLMHALSSNKKLSKYMQG